MAVMNRAKFAKQLEGDLNTVFGLDYVSHPEQWRKVFEVITSKKAFEEDVLVSGFGAAPVKAEGSATAYDEGVEGWTARYTHETIALQFAITEEAIEDNLYMSMGAKYAKALSRSLQHTKEIKGAGVFNNGFNASYTGGDGKPLFASDHPLTGGGTFSNVLATPADLSETSVEDLLIQISYAQDDRGIPMSLMAEKLVVSPSDQFVAAKILGTDRALGSNNNDINVINNQGIFGSEACVITRLTDPNAWFIKTDCPDGLKHMDRVGLSKRIKTDHDTGNYQYLARERYSFGWSDPRGAFGSAGSS